MITEYESCSTCTHHDHELRICRTMDVSTEDFDGCNCHETYTEMLHRIETTQMRCKEHDEYFPNQYKYCPYCGKKLMVPLLLETNPVGESNGNTRTR